ncbi:type II and III secretion system protein [Terriglobus saanensis SP1PR4]|uniref:Type II and III secretion system protein n=1 Tax=Terriglobus saanensis (strain ATCC BAA-1853 / DSM 23119 / SP1PR4) TaxID=401053 RepID=E8V063_TERSS|nr:type II and III secretion system protein [Terriglobus saanensis SP1PR4]
MRRCACRFVHAICCVCLCGTAVFSPVLRARADTTKEASQKVSAKDANAAEAVYMDGAKRFKAGDFAEAEKLFARAAQLNPQHNEYVLGLTTARQRRAAQLVQQAALERQRGHDQQANSLLSQARVLSPDDPLVQQHFASAPAETPGLLHEVLAGEIVLQPLAARQTFHLRSDTRSILQQVAQKYGLRVSYDAGVTSKPIRLDLEDVTYDQAMPIVLMMTKLMAIPLDEKTILVAEDTPGNRERLERQMEEMVSLPGLTTEQLNDIGNIVRNIFDVKQATVQPHAGTLVLRASAEKLNAINRTLEDLIDGGSEVLLRLRLYSVSKNKSQDTGLTPPQSLTAFSPAGAASSLISANQTLADQIVASGALGTNPSQIAIALALIASGVSSNLLTGSFLKVGGGLSTVILSTANSPTLNLTLSSSDSRSLDDVQLRLSDRETGTFRSGSRFPIVTSTYSSGISTAAGSSTAAALLSQFLGSSASSVVVPQIQYEDLGLTLKATPHMQRSGDVSVHLELKIEALSGQAQNDIPILANQLVTSDLTLRAGETAMIMGLLTRSQSKAISGIPGLSDLPGFQSITDNTGNKMEDEMVLLLTPVVVRRGHINLAGPYIPFQIHATN